MRKLILVNGIPASGKSSVAKTISEYFNAPLLSIDEIKEPFMVQFADIIDRPLNRKLGFAAYKAMFNIIQASPDDTLFILDAWFGFRDREVLEEYLEMVNCQSVIEVWNDISAPNVADRYMSRCGCRIKGHPGKEYVPELEMLAEKAQPMSLGAVYIVDQDNDINHQDLLDWITQRLNNI